MFFLQHISYSDSKLIPVLPLAGTDHTCQIYNYEGKVKNSCIYQGQKNTQD